MLRMVVGYSAQPNYSSLQSLYQPLPSAIGRLRAFMNACKLAKHPLNANKGTFTILGTELVNVTLPLSTKIKWIRNRTKKKGGRAKGCY